MICCYECGSEEDLIELEYVKEDGSKYKAPVPICRKCFFGNQETDWYFTHRRSRLNKTVKKLRYMRIFEGDEYLYDE